LFCLSLNFHRSVLLGCLGLIGFRFSLDTWNYNAFTDYQVAVGLARPIVDMLSLLLLLSVPVVHLISRSLLSRSVSVLLLLLLISGSFLIDMLLQLHGPWILNLLFLLPLWRRPLLLLSRPVVWLLLPVVGVAPVFVAVCSTSSPLAFFCFVADFAANNAASIVRRGTVGNQHFWIEQVFLGNARKKRQLVSIEQMQKMKQK
jgi:hypothetical protein